MFDAKQSEISRFCAAHNGRCKGMLATLFETGGKTQKIRVTVLSERLHRYELRLAFGERSSLVDDESIDFFESLECFCLADQDTGLRTAARPDHWSARCGEREPPHRVYDITARPAVMRDF